MPARIVEWLHNRGVSDAVIQNANLSWDGRLVIPVYDIDGHFLFNKYRRDPESTDATPKYTYDKGATMQLYNMHTARLKGGELFICEGELDVLTLESIGLSAVSTTGGAGSFDPDWSHAFWMRDIYICYDNDPAGLKGAMKVQQIFPRAKVVLLSRNGGKDVTEFIKREGYAEFQKRVEKAQIYDIPNDSNEIPRLKNDIRAMAGKFKNAANAFVEMQQRPQVDPVEWYFIDLCREYTLERYDHYQRLLKSFNANSSANENKDRLLKVKQVPIPLFMKFNRENFAPCPFHNEKTPSLKYYPKENRLYCFGSCQRSFDVVDVVCHERGLEFKEAIDFLLSQK